MIDARALGCSQFECLVFGYHRQGWSVPRIAYELGVSEHEVHDAIVDVWILDNERAMRW